MLRYLLLFIFFSSSLFSKESLNYPDYQSIVKNIVSRIPELQPVWELNKSKKGKQQYYICGGVLRGVLNWINIQLKSSSKDEVTKLKVPSLLDLLIVKKTDIDLVVPNDTDKTQFTKSLPSHQISWDLLSYKRFEEMHESGSSSIENVMVNPNSIIEPTKGLLLFYQNRLELQMPTYSEFYKHPFIEYSTWSATVKILRYLRLKNDLPYLQTTESDKLYLKNFTKKEILFLNQFPGSKSWFQKALYKLYLSNKGNLKKTLLQLRDSFILPILIGANIKFEKLGIPLKQYKDLVHLFSKDLGKSPTEMSLRLHPEYKTTKELVKSNG